MPIRIRPAAAGQRLSMPFSALHHRNYRLFLAGQCVSVIGTWMQNIGQAWLVLELTSSSFRLGLMTALQYLPLMLFSLFAGTVADRFSKKKILLFTQISLMILALALATLTTLNVVRYWHVLVLALLLGMVNTLDIPTRQSFMFELVGRDDLMNAIALNSTVFNLGRILGPAVAGILIGLLGIGICFYLNAASFVAVIVGIFLIRIPARTVPVPTAGVKRTFGDILDGLNYAARQPAILMPLVMLAFLSIFVMNYQVLIPVYAREALGQGSTGYGFLMTAMGLGSLTAALRMATRSCRTGPDRRILVTGAAGMSLFILLTGLSHWYILACLCLYFAGFFTITFATSVNTTIQLAAEDDKRGRVMSLYAMAFGGLTPIGSLFTGQVSEIAGIAACLVICGAIGLLFTVAFSMIFLDKWLRSA